MNDTDKTLFVCQNWNGKKVLVHYSMNTHTRRRYVCITAHCIDLKYIWSISWLWRNKAMLLINDFGTVCIFLYEQFEQCGMRCSSRYSSICCSLSASFNCRTFSVNDSRSCREKSTTIHQRRLCGKVHNSDDAHDFNEILGGNRNNEKFLILYTHFHYVNVLLPSNSLE